MGGKRKGKQKDKITKKENLKSKNQVLLQHYFPNLCENKSKTYQNVLKKPNGVMKQERKFKKQLLTEETLIIKQMNGLFRDIFKEADHELINELAEMLIQKRIGEIKDVKSISDRFSNEQDKKCQGKVGDRLQQDSLTGSVRNQQDAKSQSTETVQELREEKQMIGLNNYSQGSRFLIDLNEFQYNPSNNLQPQRNQKQYYTHKNMKNLSLSQPIQAQQQYQTKQQNQQDATITNQKVDFIQPFEKYVDAQHTQIPFNQKKDNHKSFDFVSKTENVSQEQTLTKEIPIESYKNPSIDSFFTEIEDKKTEEILQKSQKLTNGIKSILSLMQKRQQIKKQGIKFKKFINELKKQQNQSHQQNHTMSHVKNLYEENQIDHDEMAFSTINFFNLNKSFSTASEKDHQFDILDIILHRNYESEDQFSQKMESNKRQIYHKQQELFVNEKIEDEISTNQKSKSQAQSSVDFENQIEYKNKNLSKPSFDLPSQFLAGYSKQSMNSSFFRKIHEWEAEKIRCVRTIEQNLI